MNERDCPTCWALWREMAGNRMAEAFRMARGARAQLAEVAR